MKEKIWNPDKIEDRIQMRAIQLRRPLSCILELTYRCNFACRMCYIRMSDTQAAHYGRMRTVEEWTDMARQLFDAGVLYLTLSGGECTLYPGFEVLYERVAQMGFRLSVMSNAGAYTDSIRELFRKYPPHTLAVTLYGGSNETYKSVTGDPSGFDKVIGNIRFLQSIGVRVSLNYTMIRQNVMDYPKISKVCQELGIPYTLITDITGHRHKEGFSQALRYRLSPAERACVACYPPDRVAEAMEEAQRLEKEFEKELEELRYPENLSIRMNPDCPETLKTHGKISSSQEDQLDTCIGAYSGCAICWNGNMQTCISMNTQDGRYSVKPFDIGFEAAWEQLKDGFQKIFRRPTACQVCRMRSDCLHNCAARRLEGTGSLYEPDPYTCQYTYLLRRCRERLGTDYT